MTSPPQTDRGFDALRSVVSNWVNLSPGQWDRFASVFRPRSYQAGSEVLRVGATEQSVYFVCSGLLRVYYLSNDGKESNKAFVPEGVLGGPLVASILGLPSYYGIEALEAAELLLAPVGAFTALYDEDPAFDRIGRKLLEQSLVRKEIRERSFLEQTATERYLDFQTRYPDLAQRIPQYHVASYLGISDVSLSRIRGALVTS